MAKKANWKTLAGLALAAATWRSIAEDLPIHDLIPPPTTAPPTPPELPGPNTACPEGFYRKLIGTQWRCWPRPPPPPPDCGQFQTPKWDGKSWRCVPKGLL